MVEKTFPTQEESIEGYKLFHEWMEYKFFFDDITFEEFKEKFNKPKEDGE